MFVIQVDKSRISTIETEILVANATNVYPIQFNFSSDWDGFEKVAVFYNDSGDNPQRYSVLITNSGIINIPFEVLLDTGATVYVGVCGDSCSNQHLPTLVIPLGRVERSICENAREAADPTPNIYQQILAELASIRSEIESGKLQGPMGPRGPKGEQGIPGDSAIDIPLDSNTLSMVDGILSVNKDLLVRSVDLDVWETMTDADKRGLVFVKLSD